MDRPPDAPAACPARPWPRWCLDHPACRWVLVPLAAAGTCTLLRLALTPILGDHAPFLLALLGVVLAAWVGGSLSGVVATVLGGVGGALLLGPSPEAFAADPSNRLQLVLYVVTGLVVAAFGGRTRASLEASRATEQRLRESEGRFRQLTEAMPQIVWTAGPDGAVRYHNARWYELTGLDPRAGDPGWLAAVHEDDGKKVAAAWRRSVETGAPYEVVQRFRRRDGQYRWHLSRGVPVRGPDGAIVKWLGTATDIDDGKRAEDALREADRRKDEFLSMLAHELRNPLAPIRLALELLRGPDPARLARAREVIGRQVEHLTRLVDDLLEVSRITRGKIRLEVRELDVADVVARALETARPLLESKRHELKLSLPEGPLPLRADPVRLAQVLSNLLNNAAKYTPPNGRIEVAAERHEGQVLLRVRDSGVGIPGPMLERVFDLFVQADRSLDRSDGGLGIGLTLARRLVEMHGGTIRAESEGPGAGSEFVVRLPVRSDAAAAPGPDASTAEPGARRRVLVVDDNADAADLLGELLRDLGHEVRIERDGLAALAAMDAFAPEVVLLDIGLPGLDGYQVAERIVRSRDGARPLLVAVTGYGQESDRRRSYDAGFDHHLVKPVDPGRLQTLLAAPRAA